MKLHFEIIGRTFTDKILKLSWLLINLISIILIFKKVYPSGNGLFFTFTYIFEVLTLNYFYSLC